MQWKKVAAGVGGAAVTVVILSGFPFFSMADGSKPDHVNAPDHHAVQAAKRERFSVRQDRLPCKYLTFSPTVEKQDSAYAVSFSLPVVKQPSKQEAKKHKAKPATVRTVVYTPVLQ